ncbi:MAG: hypothetical protein QXS54_11655 [Candidatus Methanomethylicaceae archaeon]
MAVSKSYLVNLQSNWGYIEGIARERLRRNKTKRHIYKYGDKLEIMGAAGEVALRKYLGLDVCLHATLDNGLDILFHGYQIDVKTTVWTPRVMFRYLQWPKDKPIKCDIAFMVAVDLEEKRANILGFASAFDIENSPVNEQREIPCYEIPVSELYCPEMLFELPNLAYTKLSQKEKCLIIRRYGRGLFEEREKKVKEYPRLCQVPA